MASFPPRQHECRRFRFGKERSCRSCGLCPFIRIGCDSEVQSLSHVQYITAAYPEIAEITEEQSKRDKYDLNKEDIPQRVLCSQLLYINEKL